MVHGIASVWHLTENHRKPMVSWAQDLFLRDDLLPEPPGLHGGICHILWTGGRWVEGGYEACIVEYKLGKLAYGICVWEWYLYHTLHSYNECAASTWSWWKVHGEQSRWCGTKSQYEYRTKLSMTRVVLSGWWGCHHCKTDKGTP